MAVTSNELLRRQGSLVDLLCWFDANTLDPCERRLLARLLQAFAHDLLLDHSSVTNSPRSRRSNAALTGPDAANASE